MRSLLAERTYKWSFKSCTNAVAVVALSKHLFFFFFFKIMRRTRSKRLKLKVCVRTVPYTGRTQSL